MKTITVQLLLWFTVHKPPPDWKLLPGRPNRTWLRAIESALRPFNIGPSYAWKKASSQERWLWTRLCSRVVCHEGSKERLMHQLPTSLYLIHVLKCTRGVTLVSNFTVLHWATVYKTVRPMLSDSCLSVLSCPFLSCPVCLSVTLVYCGQTLGWIKMKLGSWHAGRPRPLATLC